MSYAISRYPSFASLLEQTREWLQHCLLLQIGRRDNRQNDFYEIFLFVPHG